MEHLKLSDGEWKLMKTLWAQQGQTLAETKNRDFQDTQNQLKNIPIFRKNQ